MKAKELAALVAITGEESVEELVDGYMKALQQITTEFVDAIQPLSKASSIVAKAREYDQKWRSAMNLVFTEEIMAKSKYSKIVGEDSHEAFMYWLQIGTPSIYAQIKNSQVPTARHRGFLTSSDKETKMNMDKSRSNQVQDLTVGDMRDWFKAKLT